MITKGQAIAGLWRGDEFVELHSIGEYDIVEVWKHPADNVTDRRHELLFAVYIDGKKKSNLFSSLDEALAGCIAIKSEGLNHRADDYFMRMLGRTSLPRKEFRGARKLREEA